MFTYLDNIVKHGALHEEGVVAPLDPVDAGLVAGDEDRGVVALHKLPHLRRRNAMIIISLPKFKSSTSPSGRRLSSSP